MPRDFCAGLNALTEFRLRNSVSPCRAIYRTFGGQERAMNGFPTTNGDTPHFRLDRLIVVYFGEPLSFSQLIFFWVHVILYIEATGTEKKQKETRCGRQNR